MVYTYARDPTTGVMYVNVGKPLVGPPPVQTNNTNLPPTVPTRERPAHRGWPVSPRGRSPSPRRSQRPEPHNLFGHHPHSGQLGQYGRYLVNKHTSAYHVGRTYQGAQWSQRRGYALLWGLLLVALLAAVAAAVYFLAKYIEEQKAVSAPDVLYPGGYYENGLYIITSTVAPPESMGIFGHDRPCNPYNNGSWSVLYPNCDTLTTRIVPINYTTTPDILAVTADSGHAVLCSGYFVMLSSLYWMLCNPLCVVLDL